MKKDINNKVEKTLQVMQHRRDVASNPYLYTRIQAKLGVTDQSAARRGLSWQWALGLALLVLNGLALWYQNVPRQATTEDLVEIIAANYDLDASLEATYELDY
ncbi:MAG: hypothetical protein KDC44_12400 [Phaeodactylibacter sp.]|nr:hypothetical protein [Phaeodactylibacter sp.]